LRTDTNRAVTLIIGACCMLMTSYMFRVGELADGEFQKSAC